MNDDTCQWPSCESTEIIARGLCGRDYMRARRAGTLQDFSAPERVCAVCSRPFTITKHRKVCCGPSCSKRLGTVRGMRARVEALPERSCKHCEEPMPVAQRRDANYCCVKCQQAAWYVANSAKLRRNAIEWAAAHPEKRKEHHARRRASKYAAPYEPVPRSEIFEASDWRCWICELPVLRHLKNPHPMSASVDHIIPLSKGGHHVRSNLALAHLYCNIAKKDNIIPGSEEVPGAVA